LFIKYILTCNLHILVATTDDPVATGSALLSSNDPSFEDISQSSLLQLAVSPVVPQYPQVGPPGILRNAPTSPFAKNAWDPNKVSPPGTFESEGCENGLMNFEGFPPTLGDRSSIKTLKLRNLIIDAAKLTQELSQNWTNLESIVIENALVSGDYGRVYLPKLTKFIHHQFHNDKTDSYKLQDRLKSILFFDKFKGQEWDVEKDVLNLNVTIQVAIGGTKILHVEPELGDILINTHYCENILKNVKEVFPVSSLSLHWCPVTNVSISKIPRSLKVLQFNNAVPSNDDLAQVVGSLGELTELHTYLRFHCEWPGYEIFLNVSSIPESLQTLSITNLDISFSIDKPSPIKSLSIGNYVTPSLIPVFDTVFKNLTSVAIFNVSADQAYPLLERVMKTHVQSILVTNLTRVTVDSITVASVTNSERVVEWFLNSVGVPHGVSCFLIECVNGNYSGRAITSFEQNFYRYTKLSFNRLETYEEYMVYDADPKDF
jgi:hypothetical protein